MRVDLHLLHLRGKFLADWPLSFGVTASFLGDITNRYHAETAIFALT